MNTRSLALVVLLPLYGCAVNPESVATMLSVGMLDEATRVATAPLALLAQAAAQPAPAKARASMPAAAPTELMLAAATARARQATGPTPIEGDRRISVGFGVTTDPNTRMIGVAADFYQSARVAIGPALQWGFDNNSTIFAPSFRGKYVFPLDTSSETLWMPYVEAGAGLVFIDKDNAPNSDRFGILLQVGGGIELRLNEKLGLGSKLLFNLLPGETFDEGSYTSWEIIQVTFAF